MRKNIAPFAIAVLLGFGIMLQTGCKKGAEPGTAADPQSEIFNIEYALKKADDAKKGKRMAMLRNAYAAAGELNERWPDDPSIESFLKKSAEDLSRIPKTVYTLSIEVKDLEAFKWALSQGVQLDTDARSLMNFRALGSKWRDFIMADYPERALPLYMEAALEQKDVNFFNAHIEAFKASGYKLYPPLERSIFYYKYCRFVAEQFAAAIKAGNPDRIRTLLSYMPRYPAVEPLDANTVSLMQNLGDYLFNELKDEALSTTFIELRYPLNRIDLSRLPFSSDFKKALTADPAYALAALQLDQWHGPLGQQETVFLIGLPDKLLQAVDQRYVEETVKLCLRKNKNKLALKLIQGRSASKPLTREDYDNMLNWAIETGNHEFLRYVLTQRKDMDIQQVSLGRLAGNHDMFMKYAPGILTQIAKNEKEETYEGPTAFEAMREVVTSTNHAAGMYLIKKYELANKWEGLPGERTLLMEVCLTGNLPAAKYLIDTKRQDTQQKTRYSASETSLFGNAVAEEGNLSLMHFAAKSGNSALIKYLASKKLSVNDRSYFGVTPLMYAVSNGHLEAVKMLLSLGANVNTTMNESLKAEPMPEGAPYSQLSTAYRRAQYGRHNEILELLKKAGARP